MPAWSQKQPPVTLRSIKSEISSKVEESMGINEDCGISLIKDPVSHTNYRSKNIISLQQAVSHIEMFYQKNLNFLYISRSPGVTKKKKKSFNVISSILEM